MVQMKRMSTHLRTLVLAFLMILEECNCYTLLAFNSHLHTVRLSPSIRTSFSSYKAPDPVKHIIISNSRSRLSASRHDLLHHWIPTTVASILLIPSSDSAWAATDSKKGPTPDELNRIRVGYEGITYLLNNFEKETTICRVRVISLSPPPQFFSHSFYFIFYSIPLNFVLDWCSSLFHPSTRPLGKWRGM